MRNSTFVKWTESLSNKLGLGKDNTRLEITGPRLEQSLWREFRDEFKSPIVGDAFSTFEHVDDRTIILFHALGSTPEKRRLALLEAGERLRQREIYINWVPALIGKREPVTAQSIREKFDWATTHTNETRLAAVIGDIVIWIEDRERDNTAKVSR